MKNEMTKEEVVDWIEKASLQEMLFAWRNQTTSDYWYFNEEMVEFFSKVFLKKMDTEKANMNKISEAVGF